MKLSAKVLVVGGGPAGAIGARTLAEWGVEVILVEKDLLFEKPCGGGVPLNAFNEIGISRELIKREVKNIRIISPSGQKVDITLKGGSLGIVARGEFDKVLRSEAEKKGVQIIEGEFRWITASHNGYKVGTMIKGNETEITAEYIVAADGVNSRVRAAVGIKPPKTLITFSEKIKEVSTECCEFWFGASHAQGSYSWVFPAEEGISVGTGSPDPGKVVALYQFFRKKRGLFPEGLKRIYKIPRWEGDLYNRNNIIFAGDSAGQVLPMNYEGIYYAMKAGEFAARAIIEGKAINYRSMWKSRFQKKFYLMNKLGSYFLKDDDSLEKLVALHRRPEVQEASMRLWLKKDSGREGLQSYIKLFRKFLC